MHDQYEEVWKDIPEYEGLYKISSSGNVKCLNYAGCAGNVKNLCPSLLKNSHNKVGYMRIKLRKGTDGKAHMIARLVASSFVLNPENKPQVNHKDGNTLNNHYSNLEWVTPSENILHSWRCKTYGGPRNDFGKKYCFKRVDSVYFYGTKRDFINHEEFGMTSKQVKNLISRRFKSQNGWVINWKNCK
jgi:hypothetical protein